MTTQLTGGAADEHAPAPSTGSRSRSAELKEEAIFNEIAALGPPPGQSILLTPEAARRILAWGLDDPLPEPTPRLGG